MTYLTIMCACSLLQQVSAERGNATKPELSATANAATIDATAATAPGSTRNGNECANATAAGCDRTSRTGRAADRYAKARSSPADADP